MKSFIVKHTAELIAGILIICIVLLSLMAFAPKGAEELVTELENLSDKVILPVEPEPTQNPVPTYVKTLPKSPVPSDEYLYTQKIYGIGDIEAKSLHVTSLGVYTIAESTCVNGDVSSQKPTVGIIKSDFAGNVTDIYSITASLPTQFITSQITAVGIVLITANSNKKHLYINIVDYDLNNANTYQLPYANSAQILPTVNGFILLCENETNSVAYSYDDNFAFASFDITDAIKIFDYGSYYVLFGNTADGYVRTDIKKSGFSVIKQKSLSGKSLIDVLPLSSSNGQIFVAIESKDGLYASTYDSDYELINSVKIGACEPTGIGSDGNKIYLGVSGSIEGIVTIDSNLSCIFITSESFAPDKIYDSIFYNDTLYLLVCENEKTAIIKYAADGTTIRYIDGVGKFFTPNGNGTFTVITCGNYYDYSCIDMYGIAI